MCFQRFVKKNCPNSYSGNRTKVLCCTTVTFLNFPLFVKILAPVGLCSSIYAQLRPKCRYQTHTTHGCIIGITCWINVTISRYHYCRHWWCYGSHYRKQIWSFSLDEILHGEQKDCGRNTGWPGIDVSFFRFETTSQWYFSWLILCLCHAVLLWSSCRYGIGDNFSFEVRYQ